MPRFILDACLIFSLTAGAGLLSACDQSNGGAGGGGATAATPPAASDTPEGRAWGTALLAWPQQGDPGRLVKQPMHKSAYDLWNDIRIPPSQVVPEEYVLEIIRVSKPLIDPLHALNGGWAAPVLDGGRLSPRSIRGIAKTIWADVRLSILEDDHDRVIGDLVLLANLPRVARAANPSDRGLMPTLGVAGMFGWAMTDVLGSGASFTPTEEECVRLRAAASWLFDNEPFGAISEANKGSWGAYESRELPLLRRDFGKLCGQ
jgi:hypothetical protein